MKRRLLPLLAVLALSIPLCQHPALSDIPVSPGNGTFTSSSSSAICINLIGQSTAYFQVNATVGPVDVTVIPPLVNGGVAPTPVPASATIYDSTGATHSQPFTPSQGTIYRLQPSGVAQACIAPDETWASQSAQVQLWATSASEPFPSTSGGGGSSCGATQSSPCYTQVLNSPLPSLSPFPYPAVVHLKAGNGTSVYADTIPISSGYTHITTATTTVLFSFPSAYNAYLSLLAAVTVGTTNTGNIVFEYGTQTTTPCDTDTGYIGNFTSTGQALGAAGNEWIVVVGQNALTLGGSYGGLPGYAATPTFEASLGLTGTTQFCAVTNGTVALWVDWAYAAHLN